MRDPADTRALHRRINRIMGQLRGIDKMIDDEDALTEDILIQINATKAALHKTGQALLELHLSSCVHAHTDPESAQAAIDEFSKAVELFSRI